MQGSRRDLFGIISTVGAATALGGCATRRAVAAARPDLYRVTDEAQILAVARAIIEEDYVATLITLDERGVPRARSIGVWAPDGDFNLWMGTRRGSRKLEQIARNPQATLHFARDDAEGGFASAYYASFMGQAKGHTDAETLRLRAPGEEYRSQWPRFPDDFAAISFRTDWLEVYGKGISGSPATWQPQAVVL